MVKHLAEATPEPLDGEVRATDPNLPVAIATAVMRPETLLTLEDVLRLLNGAVGRSKVLEHIKRLRPPGARRSRILLRRRDYERLVDSLTVGLAETGTSSATVAAPDRDYQTALALLQHRGKPGPRCDS